MELEKIKTGHGLLVIKEDIEGLLNNKSDTYINRFQSFSDNGKEKYKISQCYKNGQFSFELPEKDIAEIEKLLYKILTENLKSVNAKIEKL